MQQGRTHIGNQSMELEGTEITTPPVQQPSAVQKTNETIAAGKPSRVWDICCSKSWPPSAPKSLVTMFHAADHKVALSNKFQRLDEAFKNFLSAKREQDKSENAGKICQVKCRHLLFSSFH